jgi:aryl sulfotransferase
MFAEGTQRFFHKGVNGRWRDLLTEGDLVLYDAKVREKLSPSLAAWLEHGRISAGEPREAGD